jgi:flagellar hook-length control protein FliK
MAPQDPTAATALSDIIPANLVPTSDQSSASIAAGPIVDTSAGVAATALPGLDNKTVADPAAQSISDASSLHLAALTGSEASAATPQAPHLAPTVGAGGADPTNATQYAGPAGGGSSVGAMGLRIARAMHDGNHTFSIELHPAELGRVDVRLSFHAEGVGVQMTVDRQETYAAFHRDRAALEQQLAQAGINLGSGGLDLRYGAQSRQPLPQQAAPTFRAAASADALAGAAQSYATSSDSLVDIMA